MELLASSRLKSAFVRLRPSRYGPLNSMLFVSDPDDSGLYLGPEARKVRLSSGDAEVAGAWFVSKAIKEVPKPGETIESRLVKLHIAFPLLDNPQADSWFAVTCGPVSHIECLTSLALVKVGVGADAYVWPKYRDVPYPTKEIPTLLPLLIERLGGMRWSSDGLIPYLDMVADLPPRITRAFADLIKRQGAASVLKEWDRLRHELQVQYIANRNGENVDLSNVEFRPRSNSKPGFLAYVFELMQRLDFMSRSGNGSYFSSSHYAFKGPYILRPLKMLVFPFIDIMKWVYRKCAYWF